MENTQPGTVDSAVLVALSRLSEEERNTKVGNHEQMIAEIHGIIRIMISNSLPDRISVLSPREKQVAKKLALGLTNREIATELGISVKTIDTHRGRALKKLGLRNNADLTRFAVKCGLISL